MLIAIAGARMKHLLSSQFTWMPSAFAASSTLFFPVPSRDIICAIQPRVASTDKKALSLASVSCGVGCKRIKPILVLEVEKDLPRPATRFVCAPLTREFPSLPIPWPETIVLARLPVDLADTSLPDSTEEGKHLHVSLIQNIEIVQIESRCFAQLFTHDSSDANRNSSKKTDKIVIVPPAPTEIGTQAVALCLPVDPFQRLHCHPELVGQFERAAREVPQKGHEIVAGHR